ncbi:MAG: DnaJ domain-containing protein [Magnetococcales bacterium]|nr:DnaJ domain-containing protein [Magnetococcales bacterium]
MNLSMPWRTSSPDLLSTVRSEETPLPPGMRRVRTTCRSCGKSLGIKYPEAVTSWKIQCPACTQLIAIELVGGRKCLVFNVKGRRTVERIGLTDQRRRFFRARCFACDETLVVPESEAGRSRHCHGCGLEYAVREEGEVYYETAVRINDELTCYREKVQESSGYVVNKNSAFFFGEEPGSAQKGGRGPGGSEIQAAMAALRREAEFWRERAEARREELQPLVVEQEKLTREKDLACAERDRFQALAHSQGEAVRAGEEACAQIVQLEGRIGLLEESLRRGEAVRVALRVEREGAREALRLREEELARARETLRLRETELARAREAGQQAVEERQGMDAYLLALREAKARLEERMTRSGADAACGHEARLRELEAENARLSARIEEKELLRGGGEATGVGEPEEWYCEEGQESVIRGDGELGQARRLLGIKGEPTLARIKTAFRRRVKRYHPDMVSALGLELRDLAHRKMQEINRAYGILMREYGHG